ncbi:hypothetical protein BSG1_07294 [Bacillus sp. SG-1]|nr:hypothetical protein BSG1_07294 [Bacillus sp. SG-1]
MRKFLKDMKEEKEREKCREEVSQGHERRKREGKVS